MSISPDQKALWGNAAALCSFRDVSSGQWCRKPLVEPGTGADPAAVIGEMAHIEGEKPGSARYRLDMTPEERDAYPNRILLCPDHHTLIDKQWATYTTPCLKEMKQGHEDWARRTLLPTLKSVTLKRNYVTDEIHSSMLPVEVLPHKVFSAPSSFSTEAELKAAVGGLFLPAFIIRSKRFYTFWDLGKQQDYLTKHLDMGKVEEADVRNWLGEPDRKRNFVALLNRCLNKITGHRHLSLDKAHDRYYFPQLTQGEPRELSYRSIGGSVATRKVVRNPITKKTGKPKSHWVHQAVRLRFHQMAPDQWVLSVRPELYYTRDGQTPVDGMYGGKRTTKRKSRMWNYDLLREVHFWREYLGDGAPRVILKMDGQSLVVSCNLLRTTISWPGIPADLKGFPTADIEDDLFSVADLEGVMREEEESGFEYAEGEEEEES